MHLLGVPDKYAMERGGWKTDNTMKAVYQNVFSEERIEVDKKKMGILRMLLKQQKMMIIKHKYHTI